MRVWILVRAVTVAWSAVACTPSASDPGDTDVGVDDAPPAMPEWMAAAFPQTRGCTVDLYDGEGLGSGNWLLLDGEGWPVARLSVYGLPAQDTGEAIDAIGVQDPDVVVSLQVIEWKGGRARSLTRSYQSSGAELIVDGSDASTTLFDEAGRVTEWSYDGDVYTTTYDELGRRLSWQSLDWWYTSDASGITATGRAYYDCVGAYPDGASTETCTGSDSRCDAPTDGTDPSCIVGPYESELTASYDADGFLATSHWSQTRLAWDAASSADLDTDEVSDTFAWFNGHTTVTDRESSGFWRQSVYSSADSAKAAFGTVARAENEREGLVLQISRGGYSRTVLSVEDCDLLQAPEVPQVILAALR